MSNKNFYKKLQKLRTQVKERRKQELYDMINDENNKLEDKIALIKMSFIVLGSVRYSVKIILSKPSFFTFLYSLILYI